MKGAESFAFFFSLLFFFFAAEALLSKKHSLFYVERQLLDRRHEDKMSGSSLTSLLTSNVNCLRLVKFSSFNFNRYIKKKEGKRLTRV